MLTLLLDLLWFPILAAWGTLITLIQEWRIRRAFREAVERTAIHQATAAGIDDVLRELERTADGLQE